MFTISLQMNMVLFYEYKSTYPRNPADVLVHTCPLPSFLGHGPPGLVWSGLGFYFSIGDRSREMKRLWTSRAVEKIGKPSRSWRISSSEYTRTLYLYIERYRYTKYTFAFLLGDFNFYFDPDFSFSFCDGFRLFYFFFSLKRLFFFRGRCLVAGTRTSCIASGLPSSSTHGVA